MNNTALSWCTNLHSAPSPSLLKPTPLPTLLIIIAQFLIIDSTGHFEAERESRMGWRRVELHCGSVWGHCCEGNWVKIPPSKRSSGGSRGGQSPPLIFRPNWGPKSRKNNWGDPPLHSMAGWWARRTRNPAVPGSSPALATWRICSRSSRVQIIGHAYK